MTYKMILDPTEIKILVIAVFGAMAFDIEIVLKYLVPLLSAATWFFLKPLFANWRGKLINWYKNKYGK